MRSTLAVAAFVLACVAGVATRTLAQGASTPAADSPQVRQLLDAAKKTAGREWSDAYDYFCAKDQTRVNRADDPELKPTRVFDNLSVIGRTGTAVWVVETSEGLVLIDAGYADQLDSVLLPGMKALGLDPARVRYVLLGHGHADHFGGAPYFQERGARVAMAAADWDLVENQARSGRGGNGGPAANLHRDLVISDGQPIVVGNVTFTPVAIPGHTPGSVGFIFPVSDHGKRHIAGLFGGTVLLPGRLTPDALQHYIASIDHWGTVTRDMKVDVEIQNHPLYDGLENRLARVQQSKVGGSNPFVVGTDSYQRFVRTMSQCMAVQAARKGAA